MKNPLFTVTLFTLLIAGIVNAQNTNDPWLTRYWDGCKPSCSWRTSDKINVNCKVCDINDNLIPNHSNSDPRGSSCDNGPQFTCWDMIPWVDPANPNLAYGYVATPSRNQQCGTCWEITFTGTGRYSTTSQTRLLNTQGKKMVVMATNIGVDVADNQLDLLVPGGGVGQYNSFTRQTGIQSGATSATGTATTLGAQYGGLLDDCERQNNWNASTYKSCLTRKCNEVFSAAGHARLRDGCLFYANFLEAAGNPSFTRREVPCSDYPELRRRYSQATGNTTGPGPQPTTYTLTVSRNPSTGGTVTPAQAVAGLTAGTQRQITATPAAGYTFTNWTMTPASGAGTLQSATSATTNITVNNNVTVTANFAQAQPTTYTLTVARNPSNVSSTINVGGTAYSTPRTINANTATAITTTAPEGHRFVNWTVTAGQATIANATSATAATVTLTANATITANFQPTYTLTVNRTPTAGGTVTQSAQTNIAAGTQVNITASAASGYTFSGWTMTPATGAGTIASASSASTSVTVNGNLTVTANFTQVTAGNSTLTVVRRTPDTNPDNDAGTVRVGTANYTVPVTLTNGTATSITATAATGFTFSGWTAGTGAAIANTNSATTTVTLTANATITANFTRNVVTPTTYMLTINRLPTAGGTVTPASGGRHNAGTPVTITAAPASGYAFTNWTITGSGAVIADVSNAATTVTLTANATITANFRQEGGTTNCPDGQVLSRTVVPEGSGVINVTPAQNCYPQNTSINVTAVANTGFEFDRWEGDGTWEGAPAELGTSTMWWNRSLTAYFKPTGGGIIITPGDRNEVTRIEAEDYSSNEGNFSIDTNEDGVTNIGYIQNGHSATYEVTAARAGAATLQFRVATGMAASNFTVWVNGTQAGTISVTNTGGWDTYTTVALTGDANLVAGINTIQLRFGSAINVDYFDILTEQGVMTPGTSIRHAAVNANKTVQYGITLKTGVKGFSAVLPANHNYTSYKLIDLLGREIRRGEIKADAAELNFSNIRQGVVFLRLNGTNGTTVLRAVTF